MSQEKQASALRAVPSKLPLFPTADSLQDVIDQGVAKLPITDKNELLALLYHYHNTLLQQVELCRN